MLLLDVACETITKAAHLHVGAVRGKPDGVGDWVNELAAKVPMVAPPHAANAARLRASRNLVQHQGQIPPKTAVAASKVDAKAFIDLVAREAFGVNFDEVSAVDLVRNATIKAFLAEAVESWRAGNAVVALAKAGTAYAAGASARRPAARPASPDSARGGQRGDGVAPTPGSNRPSCLGSGSRRRPNARRRSSSGTYSARPENAGNRPVAATAPPFRFHGPGLLRSSCDDRCSWRRRHPVVPRRRSPSHAPCDRPIPGGSQLRDVGSLAVSGAPRGARNHGNRRLHQQGRHGARVP